MLNMLFRFGTPLLGIGCLVMVCLILAGQPWSLALLESDGAQEFKIVFLSIILEAFPFILLGVIFSALLQVFVTDEMVRKLTPKHHMVGILFGALLGLVFPLCECGMIPVVRRLIRKGMPAYIGIVYLLAGPIINPIVFTSTYAAFRSEPQMAYDRLIIAFIVTVIVGLLLHRFMKDSPLKESSANISAHRHEHNHDNDRNCDHEHHNHQTHEHSSNPVKKSWRLSATLSHASDEFFDMGKYLIFGALLTAVIQSFIDRQAFEAVADQPVLSYIFMMGLAFLLSICSTSDAFIAASFGGMFDHGPLLAFLVFGPMIDLKNTMMMLSAFRARIVLSITLLTFALVLASVWLLEVLR
ncbi:permease [Paenibacillus sp. JDR-2]|uniref:permease n=1 Tax=Paenibacillus sp. (strain JDR-2) TaxID=324057 RepID=UPI000166B285|nr:permease [Paenibacillus sp. JDR-2]ACT03496.1 permease [Paenibacillus sp. JDR-2]